MKKMWNSSISIILSTAVVTVTGRGMESIVNDKTT